MDTMDMSLSKVWEMVNDREASGAAVCQATESDTTESLNSNNKMHMEAKDYVLYSWVSST